MARPRYPKSAARCRRRCLPLTRTVGQLVAETLKIYGEHWKAALVIGLPPALLERDRRRLLARADAHDRALRRRRRDDGSFVIASAVVSGVEPPRARHRRLRRSSGVLIYFPFPLLAALFVLPGLAWFALIGLAVPAAIAEGLGVRDALRRGLALGRADYVHALGGLATLVMLVFVTQIAASLCSRASRTTPSALRRSSPASFSRRCSSSARRCSTSTRRRGSARPARSAWRRGSPHASLRRRL